MNQIEEIKKMIEPILSAAKVELYDCDWHKSGKSKILQIAIMHEDGEMDIDTCQEISEKISLLLDEHEDMIPFEYFLEVCSPGAERILRTHKDILHACGKHVYIKLKHAIKSMNEVTGDLLECNENTLIVEYADKSIKRKVSINEDEIEMIRLAVKF